MQTCVKCGLVKTDAEMAKGRKDCKACRAEAARKSWAANREKRSAVKREHYRVNRPAILAYQREYRRANKERRSNANYLRNYGITLDQYDAMYEAQRERCAACGQPEVARRRNEETIRRLAVDHDHLTGEVRGLLCSGCNTALGLLGEDEHRIDALARYVAATRVREAIA